MERVYRKFAEVYDEIPHGALLLWQPGGWWLSSRLIARGGRGEWCHAGMADTVHGPRCLHTREFRGGLDEPLVDLVAQAPGKIDVFAPNLDQFRKYYSPAMAVEAMRTIVGRRYGWRSILRVSLSHLAGIRLFVRPITDDEANDRYPPHCSGAVSRACSAGGVDPVLRLPAYLTEPCDLARSHLFAEYLFTLT